MRLGAPSSLLLGLAGLAAAQFASVCPAGSGNSAICYSVNVPSSSAKNGSGDIYFQIKGPSSKSWIGLGQGTGMAGSNIFVIYSNQNGNNVTLSPRAGKGEFEPYYNGGAQVSLISGSGISGGVMTANVKCSNCNTWSGGSMSFTDSKSNWIWASADGSSVDSNSPSAQFMEHDQYGNVNFDLTQAVSDASTNGNPFVGPPSSGSPNGGPYTSTADINFAYLSNVRLAHGIVLGLAFLLFFPLGALIIRLATFKATIWVHAGVQMLSYTLAIAGLGMGIWMATTLPLLNSYHAIIGLVVICLLVLQVPLGLLHHRLYKSRGGRTTPSYLHIWLGRSLTTLGAINGAFGLALSCVTGAELIAWSVLTAVVYAGYFLAIIFASGGRRNRMKNERGEEMLVRKGRGREQLSSASSS